jgi:hypothetical protein
MLRRRPIRKKRGEVESEDLSGNLIVQLGVATEELKRRWYELTTGQVITGLQRHVKHAGLRWVAATLDGRVTTIRRAELAASAERHLIHGMLAQIGGAPRGFLAKRNISGEFNRSMQHYLAEALRRGAGAIPPLRAKNLDTVLVPRALGRRRLPSGRSFSAPTLSLLLWREPCSCMPLICIPFQLPD